MVSVKIVGLIVGSVAVATLVVNRTFAEDPSHTMTAAAASAPTAKIRVVRVSGEDFKFDAPDVIPAGLSDFRFLNKGPALHHMSILKLTDGKTVDDLRAVLANPGPPPAWVKEVGGPNAAAPGVESNATVMLEPGNYALICFVDIGGPPHFMKGMLKGLRVVAATGPVTAKPTPDVTVTLVDYNFKLSAPIRAAHRPRAQHRAATPRGRAGAARSGRQRHRLHEVDRKNGRSAARKSVGRSLRSRNRDVRVFHRGFFSGKLRAHLLSSGPQGWKAALRERDGSADHRELSARHRTAYSALRITQRGVSVFRVKLQALE